MRFNRKIAPEIKPRQNFITKKRLKEDEIDFDKLRSYRLDRVRKELIKNNLEACILFDPVNVRYALDTVNMSVYNMHNLTRYCFVPVNGPTILYEYFNCEILSKHLNLIDEIRPAITWDYFSNGDQANNQLSKWINEVKDLSNNYFKSKKIAIDVLNGPAVSAFPDGPLGDEPDSEGVRKPLAGVPEDHVAESSEPINVIVVGDTDMLIDASWVQSQQFLGRVLNLPVADNGAFVANALELLGGGSSLVGLRTRGTGQRPFEVVDELQREAELQFRETESGLQRRLEETEKKISEMRSAGGASVEMLSAEEAETIAAFQRDMLSIRKELREVRHELRKDIEGLGTILKVINIGGIPVLVGFIAIFVSLIRRRYRRRALEMG